MTERPTQNELAAALGISKQAVSKNKKQGMPVDSLEAALAWRRRHLNVAQRKPDPKPLHHQHDCGPEVQRANDLIRAAASMIGAGQAIDAMVPSLRAALSGVALRSRDLVQLDLQVIKALVREVLEALPPAELQPMLPEGGHVWAETMTDQEARDAGEFWYALAAGELTLDAVTVQAALNVSEASAVNRGSYREEANAGNSHRACGLFRGSPKGVMW